MEHTDNSQQDPLESGIKRISEILSLMEQNDLSVTEMTRLHAEGLALIKQCRSCLDEARLSLEEV